MKEITTSGARKEFSEVINQAVYNKERITIKRHGKKVAALVPYEDLLLLEKLENELGAKAARNTLNETDDSIPK